MILLSSTHAKAQSCLNRSHRKILHIINRISRHFQLLTSLWFSWKWGNSSLKIVINHYTSLLLMIDKQHLIGILNFWAYRKSEALNWETLKMIIINLIRTSRTPKILSLKLCCSTFTGKHLHKLSSEIYFQGAKLFSCTRSKNLCLRHSTRALDQYLIVSSIQCVYDWFKGKNKWTNEMDRKKMMTSQYRSRTHRVITDVNNVTIWKWQAVNARVTPRAVKVTHRSDI